MRQLGHQPADDDTHCKANERADRPAAEDLRALFAWEIRTEERGACGGVAGLSQTQPGPCDQQDKEGVHEAGDERSRAPERDAIRDHIPALDTIGENAQRERAHGVDKDKGATELAGLDVIDTEFRVAAWCTEGSI